MKLVKPNLSSNSLTLLLAIGITILSQMTPIEAFAQRSGGHGGGNGTFFYNQRFRQACAKALTAMKVYDQLKTLHPEQNQKSIELYSNKKVRRQWIEKLELAAFSEGMIEPKDEYIYDHKNQSRAAVAFPEDQVILISTQYMKEVNYTEANAFVDCIEETGHLIQFEGHEEMDDILSNIGTLLLGMMTADPNFEQKHQSTLNRLPHELQKISPVLLKESAKLAIWAQLVQDHIQNWSPDPKKIEQLKALSQGKDFNDRLIDSLAAAETILVASLAHSSFENYANGRNSRATLSSFLGLGIGYCSITQAKSNHFKKRDRPIKELELKTNLLTEYYQQINQITREIGEILLLTPDSEEFLANKIREKLSSRLVDELSLSPTNELNYSTSSIRLIDLLNHLEDYEGNSALTNARVRAYAQYLEFIEKTSKEVETATNMDETLTSEDPEKIFASTLRSLQILTEILTDALQELPQDSELRQEMEKSLKTTQFNLNLVQKKMNELQAKDSDQNK